MGSSGRVGGVEQAMAALGISSVFVCLVYLYLYVQCICGGYLMDKTGPESRTQISRPSSRQADSAGKCPIKLVPEQPRGGGDVGARVFEGGLRWTFQG